MAKGGEGGVGELELSLSVGVDGGEERMELVVSSWSLARNRALPCLGPVRLEGACRPSSQSSCPHQSTPSEPSRPPGPPYAPADLSDLRSVRL